MNWNEIQRGRGELAVRSDNLQGGLAMRAVRWVVIALALGRVIHSLPYFAAAWTGEWLLPPFGAGGPEVMTALQEVSTVLLIVWTGYMAGFLATGLLLIVPGQGGIKFAFPAAALAVFLDLGYWIWITAEPLYTGVDRPEFLLEDAIMNIASLAVMLGAGLLRFWPQTTA